MFFFGTAKILRRFSNFSRFFEIFWLFEDYSCETVWDLRNYREHWGESFVRWWYKLRRAAAYSKTELSSGLALILKVLYDLRNSHWKKRELSVNRFTTWINNMRLSWCIYKQWNVWADFYPKLDARRLPGRVCFVSTPHCQRR